LGETVASYLKARMTRETYDRLEAASMGWTKPLFVHDRETGLFECNCLVDGDDDEPDAVLDALCLACELLSESGLDFSGDRSIATDDDSGSIDLEYTFSLEEEDVYRLFRRLLEDLTATEAGIHARFQKYVGGFSVVVRLNFSHSYEYQRQKDAVGWLLHLARRRVADVPFRGTRL